MRVLEALLRGYGIVAVAMALLWLVQRRTGKAGFVDVAWTFGVGLLAVWFAWLGEGDGHRRLLVAALAVVWSFRLGGYLFWRVLRSAEDGRYEALKRAAGAREGLVVFLFFQIQAIWALLFAVPMLLAARNPRPFPGLQDGLALLLFLIAVIGESLADRQLARFRGDPANKGKVCRDGLWAWSRHPNYFFEWIHWFAWTSFAYGAPQWGWAFLFGPLLMFVFVTRITGIPPTEAQSLRSRGEAYRRYQEEVPAFWPRPPRRKGSES